MKISKHEARKIAELAHLEFDDAALDTIAREMTEILGYIDQLRDVEVPSELRLTHREPDLPLETDAQTLSLPASDVARNAPLFLHDHFVLPRVVGGD